MPVQKRQFKNGQIVRITFHKAKVLEASAPKKPPIEHCWSYRVRIIGWAFDNPEPCPDIGHEAWTDPRCMIPLD